MGGKKVIKKFKNLELRWNFPSSGRVAFWHPGSVRATTNCHFVYVFFVKKVVNEIFMFL